MSKLIQLKVGQDKIKRYNELVELLCLTGTYGEYQRAIEFSIDLAISTLKSQAEVLPTLEAEKLSLFAETIAKIRKAKDKAAKAAEIAKTM